MPAVRKKVHPLIAKMQYEADIRGVSNEELAAAMRMSERTLCRRKSHPNELSVDELTKLAKKLKMEIVITADGLECK